MPPPLPDQPVWAATLPSGFKTSDVPPTETTLGDALGYCTTGTEIARGSDPGHAIMTAGVVKLLSNLFHRKIPVPPQSSSRPPKPWAACRPGQRQDTVRVGRVVRLDEIDVGLGGDA